MLREPERETYFRVFVIENSSVLEFFTEGVEIRESTCRTKRRADFLNAANLI